MCVDNTPPTGSVSINDGSDMTQTAGVTLTLSATDATTSVTQMMVSNSANFTGASWETYATTKNWALTSTEGEREVYVKYKDEAGNVSETYIDSIVLAYPTPTPTPTPTPPSLLELTKIGNVSTIEGVYTYYYTNQKIARYRNDITRRNGCFDHRV